MIKSIVVLFLSILLFPQFASSDLGSIFALQQTTGKRITKNTPGSYVSTLNSAIDAQQVERLQYRGYFILLNHVNGQYEVQAYKLVRYGSKQVNSIFASQFQASVEYAYSYDASGDRIRRDHYLFPPNSLTGWANPTDYLTLKEFPWKERFPSKSCRTEVHSNEEYGREYIEASCFSGRDAALQFAKKFVDFVLGTRGM